MEIANDFSKVKDYNLSKEIKENEYIKKFAGKMIDLSNRLNKVEDDPDKEWRDDEDIYEDYAPCIREFILNITGL